LRKIARDADVYLVGRARFQVVEPDGAELLDDNGVRAGAGVLEIEAVIFSATETAFDCVS